MIEAMRKVLYARDRWGDWYVLATDSAIITADLDGPRRLDLDPRPCPAVEAAGLFLWCGDIDDEAPAIVRVLFGVGVIIPIQNDQLKKLMSITP